MERTETGWCHISMKVTLEGREVEFEDLSDVTQEHIAQKILEGYKSIEIVELIDDEEGE